MSREDLILSIRRLMEEFSEKEAILEINSGAATEMAIQFQQIKGETQAQLPKWPSSSSRSKVKMQP